MKRIRFTETVQFESEGRHKGPTYKEGSTHDFEDGFADRWLRREVAVEVNTRTPLPNDEDAVEQQADPLDHDANGEKGGAVEAAGEPATAEEIIAAIEELDADDDDHWTAAGLPKVEALSELTGKTVTRAAITDAAPDAKRVAG